MKEIQLSHGYSTVVDDEDYERLSQHLWIAVKPGPDHVNAVRTVDGVVIYMHREIINATPDEKVYHLDGDRLNNRKDNLIVKSNLFPAPRTIPNRRKLQEHDPNRKSRFCGVKWDIKRSKYYAYIEDGEEERVIARFSKEINAAQEYDRFVIRENLPRPTNFPKQDYMKVDENLIREKKCVGCGETKPPEEFFVEKTEYGKFRRSSRCKVCRVVHSREWAREKRKRIKTEIARIKDVPCEDCGKRYPHYVMQFHHTDPSQKKKPVGESSSIEMLLAEIGKCAILCANCHLEREWGEGGLSRRRWDSINDDD